MRLCAAPFWLLPRTARIRVLQSTVAPTTNSLGVFASFCTPPTGHSSLLETGLVAPLGQPGSRTCAVSRKFRKWVWIQNKLYRYRSTMFLFSPWIEGVSRWTRRYLQADTESVTSRSCDVITSRGGASIVYNRKWCHAIWQQRRSCVQPQQQI